MQNESQGFGEKWKIKMGFGNKMENKDVGFRKTGKKKYMRINDEVQGKYMSVEDGCFGKNKGNQIWVFWKKNMGTFLQFNFL